MVCCVVSSILYGCCCVGEDIAQATEREVLEETGVHASSQGIICFRHQHDYKFDCSDFYFVSLMRPQTLNIDIGANEISECHWMPVRSAQASGKYLLLL